MEDCPSRLVQVGQYRGFLLINEFNVMRRNRGDKAGSHQESNSGHLWLELPVLCHWATTARQPPTLTILYMYCTGGTECLSHTPGSHSACAIRTPLGVDWKILSIRKESMLSVFLTRNAQSILPLIMSGRLLSCPPSLPYITRIQYSTLREKGREKRKNLNPPNLCALR